MLRVYLPDRSRVTDLPEPTVARCAWLGAYKGMIVGVFTWLIASIPWPYYGYAKWTLTVNFFYCAVLAAVLIALMDFLERWPYIEYEFRHSFSDTISFASASTAVYFIFQRVHIFLNS
ncbi:hypothetical protein A3A18_00050 [Candidatus Azambacteria bacterium RIFCSPLOWO2_01_FULL_44_84]|uniref:Uncharacterized protein n=1 Tax=Candidatus Azambacteria bacterium RIFCSPLOWO2_02_FULL_44_14 TaxID=1797306 RepID=A0A1F5CBM2_9BACT|nr:MAG: hypothetical protein A3A18_00050 [Candidatus Azambacteria bacterium RIFCSPLOWO2_01_FULL_44_84]OGD33164.1 MAG: hypothetical protein A3C78_02800 [Candidatus Azambacteria bacterium RIFCSPHIGHO2_02_FULL_45_18]OGD40269.1 MAG: hypothetical protein A3I30_03160 [Candidatus Azambacteria bacterium RIFCSPLOWO2_02_FULL_44_14]